MNGPKWTGDYPDRELDCQMELEDAFQGVIAKAVANGWGRDESADAMLELARNYILALIENAKTDAAILAARATN